jgi:glycosyltransferase involved in cell wall biosynthesis
MKSLVSILVPIYGVEKYIERCARSLFEQTYSNIEYVFVNDCTKDKSIELLMNVLNEYPHRKGQVKLIHHERNRGLAAARNTAVYNMTGEYVWHVDSDDYIETQAVELLVNEIQKTNAEVIIFGYNTVISYQITPFSVYKTEKHTSSQKTSIPKREIR